MRRTIAKEIRKSGTALHAGGTVNMTLSPAPSGSGVLFRRADLGGKEIPALYDRVGETRLGTVIAQGDASVGVIEHLMAAVAGAEIDDLLVTVDGPEPPILDGDALSYFRLLDEAGNKEQSGERKAIKVTKPVEITIKDARIRLLPSDTPEYSYDLDYSNTKAIGKQSYRMTLTRENFAREIAPARTFGFTHELDALHKMGLGRGASLENTLAIEGDEVLNKDLMRFPDEFVRHKILDAIGDMALAGGRLIARFEGVKSGHATNNAVLRALFADPSCYEIVEL
ncbi:MAG TPA: UDP-3-O-acyl-N-acetylglucosamine deacetylase [Rhizomicrobium sp.]|jgi:UDP-3-O-[3-hydroxymyristoyl] N-acetylglucosamine deacetylase|nr:UDP-3-O-acyl-N-acetylglucosamine deacetylase [Rhizomicrobium sp.]